MFLSSAVMISFAKPLLDTLMIDDRPRGTDMKSLGSLDVRSGSELTSGKRREGEGYGNMTTFGQRDEDAVT